MHRTQIMLEQRQYEALRERAKQDGKSMGQLIRELLDVALAAASSPTRGRRRLQAAKGMFHEPKVHGRDHDRYLYGAD